MEILARQLEISTDDIRAIAGFLEYFVTSTGKVFFVDFIDFKIFEVTQYSHKRTGKNFVMLIKDHKIFQRSVAKLVVGAFIQKGNINEYYIKHLDGNSANNSSNNLALIYRYGRSKSNSIRRLTLKDKIAIFDEIISGLSIKECSLKWGVSRDRIRSICKQSIRYVEGERLWHITGFYSIQSIDDVILLLRKKFEIDIRPDMIKTFICFIEGSKYTCWGYMSQFYLLSRKPLSYEKRTYKLPDMYVKIDYAFKNKYNKIVPSKYTQIKEQNK